MKRVTISLRSSLLFLGIGVTLGILTVLLVMNAFSGSSASTQITATTLKTSLESASELIATKYNYAKVGQFTNSMELNGWTIPFTQKEFLLCYQGQASLGVNMEEAQITVDEQTITIFLPPVEILSNTIDEQSIEVYNESTNLFNPIRVSDYVQFALQQKEVAARQMEEEGVYETAEKDAARAIRSLLEMIPDVKENYTIEIEFAPRPASDTGQESKDTEDDSASKNTKDKDTADTNSSESDPQK